MHLLTDRRRQSYSPSLAMDGHLCKRMQQTHVYGKSSMARRPSPVPTKPFLHPTFLHPPDTDCKRPYEFSLLHLNELLTHSSVIPDIAQNLP